MCLSVRKNRASLYLRLNFNLYDEIHVVGSKGDPLSEEQEVSSEY